MPAPLACSVRGCGRQLTLTDGAWRCDAGHAFDVARAGYVNLLQPQDRRSKAPGDRDEAIRARSRLLAAGVGTTLLDAVANVVTESLTVADPVIIDLGSGGGEFLGRLARRTPVTGIGLDLATTAATLAARAYPSLTWLVTNADRRLPLGDHAVDVIVSIHGRRNPSECARVLKQDGRMIVAVPAADDLIELRHAVLGRAPERNRVDTVVAEHAGAFSVDERVTCREQRRLTPDQLSDLLVGTYRGARHAARPQRTGLIDMAVTLASDIVVLGKR